MPTIENKNGILGIEHSGRHPDEYVKNVNDLIKNADKIGGRQGVINELFDIKNKLQNAPRNTDWRNVL